MDLISRINKNFQDSISTKQLAAELPDVKVVILTASDDDTHLFDAIKAGAKGYLLKDLESGQFFSLLEGVERGEPALTPAVARKRGTSWLSKKRVIIRARSSTSTCDASGSGSTAPR